MIRDVFGNLSDSLLSAGSIVQSADGSLTITSAPARYVAWVVAFALMASISRWCWNRGIGGRTAPAIFCASLFIPIIVLPGIATERVQVTSDAIVLRGGLWLAPNNRTISLSDLDEIREREEPSDQRDRSRHDTFWYFDYGNGEEIRLDLSDLLEANRSHVVEFLRAQGHRFSAPPRPSSDGAATQG